MKAFEFDQSLIRSYEQFSRSFSTIRADDLRKTINHEYDAGRFWPDALLSLNPRYLSDHTVQELVESGTLDTGTAQVFRFGETSLRLHRHQAEAIAKAKSGKSFVVTTGTGSGKSLCFFIPVVDAVIRSLRLGQPRRTRAIIIYPMNALANSQMKEIDKFISQSDLPDEFKPQVKRYTGQESQEERKKIADNPPDILLTNYMMAELILTRQDALDAQVIQNASGLEFIILDELHTYRGRQGADVAVLVRRLRDRCARDRAPIFIGTSATMASEGSDENRALEVAKVATRLFGAEVGPDAVIDESLQRATDDRIDLNQTRSKLAEVINQPLPDVLDDATLRTHPLAVWAELALGFDDGRELKRKKPIPFQDAVEQLAMDSGLDQCRCREVLQDFLTRISLPESMRGGTGDGPFLAFKLHRFISGAGDVFTTLTQRPRRVLFEGQLEDPEAPGNRLYPTRFCRNCGHEYHVVTRKESAAGIQFLPRNIDDAPLENDRETDTAGYLCPIPERDAEFTFDGTQETYPESWKEERNGVERLRTYRRRSEPKHYLVQPNGRHQQGGREFWFIPGKFLFCLCCQDEPTQGMRERSKLAGLSGEGRSSATTLLTSSALQWMNEESNGVPETKRKLLGFTDNRQDAALQSGHFNDFIFVSLLRGAILRSLMDVSEEGMTEDEFGLRVVKALGFTAENKKARVHWMQDPVAGAVIRENAQRSLAKVMAHRVWNDLRRGWRYTNPSLASLNLLDVQFAGVQEVASDQALWDKELPFLSELPESDRAKVLGVLLGAMLEGLAVHTENLDNTVMDGVAQKSRSLLCSPWAIDIQEDPRARTALVVSGPSRSDVRLSEEQTLIRAGHNSRIARLINRSSLIGARLKKEEYLRFIEKLLEFLEREGIVVSVELDREVTGWRITPSAVRLVPGLALSDTEQRGNPYFTDLYLSVAKDLASGHCTFWGLEGREHTAQVSQKQREWREWRFRFEDGDRENLSSAEFAKEIRDTGESDQFLPALFCSPTMELGVDISALNAVYLRNVPPTPANYAQRAGRAGRSGQAALVFTYCAAGSPHDQYFFERRNDMVAGVVRPPALDITNEELVRSHLHAVWLAESGLALSPDIPDVLNLNGEGYPIKEEILSVINRKELLEKSVEPMTRILYQILSADGGAPPSWMGEPEEFVRQVAGEAPQEFDRSFDRWRELYSAAHNQLAEANRNSEMTGLSIKDRNKITRSRNQANDQLAILEQGKATNGSDFYTYRYLATEGFLPGYNFPRLPLYAFIPGEGKSGSYLSRARFLAISEFGPRSLIYHEGRAYRIMKAKLPPGVSTEDGDDLSTQDIYICPNCGACHEEEVERCHGCDHSMAGQMPVRRTLRINNVEARPTDRITANDEERVRQGFEIQTVFSWPRKDGRLQVTCGEFVCEDRSLLTLQYANSAEISRLNKGLKRRKDQTVFGFHIDPRTGWWAKSDDGEPDGELPPDQDRSVRVVPIVRDRKNALLFRFKDPQDYEPSTLTTIQHALVRGIEVVYQLETGEILGEPLPSKDNRRAILAYEATEGGAGVLTRLIEDPEAISKVAQKALELMHFTSIQEAVESGNAERLESIESEACVSGCYRCLFSYFNQPEQELIHRNSQEVKQLLVDLARGRTVLQGNQPSQLSDSPWLTAFTQAGLPPSDATTVKFAGTEVCFAWRSHLVAATTTPVTSEMLQDAAGHGWEIVALPESPNEGVPSQLLDLFRN